MSNTAIISKKAEKNADGIIDLLDRQPDIDRIKKVISLLSNQKKNACFAINGAWGVGKSHMLNVLEQQIEAEADSSNKYLVFHYNCWQYDYYDEPLVAMVASILDTLDEKENLIPKDFKESFIACLKILGGGAIRYITKKASDSTGINFDGIINSIKSGHKLSKERIAESHEYDNYFAFKKILKALRISFEKLSEDKTIIFVVDELDRCLPEYAIKVIERLHHIFYDIPNVQVIISIDRAQFGQVIENIYGENTDTKKYLAKFIQFEIKLSEGTLNDQFTNRFSYYTGLFDVKYPGTKSEEVDEFLNMILDGIDMRRRIEIIDKCFLVHDLLIEQETTMDSAYMCIEVLLTILKYCETDSEDTFDYFNINSVFGSIICDNFPGFEHLNEVYRTAKVQRSELDYEEIHRYYNVDRGKAYISTRNIWGIVLAVYRCVLLKEDDDCSSALYYSMLEYAQDFWNLLDVIS